MHNIVLEGIISIEGGDYRDIQNRSLAFKNNASFVICIWNINNVLFSNAWDLDIGRQMLNLIKYSLNYGEKNR